MPRPLSESVQDYVVPWRQCSWPIPWAERFGRRAPLVLEVGFGNGDFLLDLARAHPEHDHVGIELSWTAARHLFRRLDQAGLTNVRILLVDAEVALGRFFEPGSLHEVFVNHPCPWPKARHHERRLVRVDSVSLFAHCLVPDGPLTIATDHADYAEWITEVLEGQSDLTPRTETTCVHEVPGRRPTKYERKARSQGLPIHFFLWKRARTPERVPPQPTDADPMPSLTLRGTTPFDSLFDEFQPRTHQEEHGGVGIVVKLASVWIEHGRPTAKVEAMVQENRLRQEFSVLVADQGDGRILLKLAHVGRPHPTHGVKRAIWLLGDWLRERHPDLQLVSENLGPAVVETG